jgi:CRISPR-associated protein Cas2
MGTLYNEVLVSYDIENNRQRARLFQALKDIALRPVQKSVFWGYLSRAEEQAVRRLLKEHCGKDDKAFIVRTRLSTEIADNNSVGYARGDFPTKPERYHVL